MKAAYKLAFMISLLLLLIVFSWSTVLAAGYQAPTPGSSPHGNYISTSNKCKVCHAVHAATGTYRLLRVNSASTECDFCHGTGGAANAKPVRLDSNGHGSSADPVEAPDDSDSKFSVANSAWGCWSCHSVHGSGVIGWYANESWANSKLLKKWPNSVKGAVEGNYTDYKPDTQAGSTRLSNWCSSCHNANIGLHTTAKTVGGASRYGHDSSATGAGGTYGIPGETNGWPVNPDGTNNGPSCQQCHIGDGDSGTTYDFPHSNGSTPALLKSGADLSQLDGVCTSCHLTSELP